MSFDLSSFVSPNKKVPFFTELLPASVDVATGIMTFDDEEAVFSEPSTIVPVSCLVMIPLAGKSKKRLDNLSCFFIPELDEENDELLVPEETIKFLFNDGNVTKQLEADGEEYIGSLPVRVATPRYFYARTLGALTRKEQSRITAMNFDIMENLKKKDPELVARLMKQVEEGKISSDRIDAALNLEIALNNPDFMEIITAEQDKQVNMQTAMLLGCSYELVQLFDDSIPRGTELLMSLRKELGLRLDQGQPNKKAEAKVDVLDPVKEDEELEPDEETEETVTEPATVDVDSSDAEEIDPESLEAKPANVPTRFLASKRIAKEDQQDAAAILAAQDDAEPDEEEPVEEPDTTESEPEKVETTGASRKPRISRRKSPTTSHVSLE